MTSVAVGMFLLSWYHGDAQVQRAHTNTYFHLRQLPLVALVGIFYPYDGPRHLGCALGRKSTRQYLNLEEIPEHYFIHARDTHHKNDPPLTSSPDRTPTSTDHICTSMLGSMQTLNIICSSSLTCSVTGVRVLVQLRVYLFSYKNARNHHTSRQIDLVVLLTPSV